MIAAVRAAHWGVIFPSGLSRPAGKQLSLIRDPLELCGINTNALCHFYSFGQQKKPTWFKRQFNERQLIVSGIKKNNVQLKKQKCA